MSIKRVRVGCTKILYPTIFGKLVSEIFSTLFKKAGLLKSKYLKHSLSYCYSSVIFAGNPSKKQCKSSSHFTSLYSVSCFLEVAVTVNTEQ